MKSFSLSTILTLLFFVLGWAGIGLADDEEARSWEIQYTNTPLPVVLLAYEELTGKRLVKDTFLDAVNITIETPGKLSRDDARRFLEQSLLLNGIAILPAGEDTLKVISIEAGKTPGAEGLPVVASLDALPDGDQIVSYIMPLEYLAPEEAIKVFLQLNLLHPYGALAPVEKANAIIVTENSSVIRSLEQLRRHIDVPGSATTQESFQLERADAEDVVAAIIELLGIGSPNVTAGASPSVNFSTGEVPAPTGAPSPLASIGGGGAPVKPQLYAATRTNRIVAIARPVDMGTIRSLVEELDRPAEVGGLVSRKLEYLPVLDLLSIAQDALLRGQISDGSTEAKVSTPLDRNGSGEITEGSSFGATGAQKSASLLPPENPGGPRSVLIGKTLLIANPTSNIITMSGSPEHIRALNEIIDDVDLRPQQIYISTVIGQLTLGDDYEHGVDLLRSLEASGGDQAAGIFNSGASGGRFPNVAELTDPSNLLPAAAGLSLYGNIGNYLDAYVNLLDKTDRFEVLSRPSIFALNNTKATIATGQRIAVPVSTFTGGQGFGPNGGVTSNIDYRDVVLKLEVIPMVNSNDEVTLRIAQVNDDIVGSTNIGGNQVPTIGTQEMITTVIVPNGQAVMLGGLVSESENESNTGIPVLNRIPVVKYLTGTREVSKTRRELVIFIRPHIITDKSQMNLPEADMRSRSEFSAEAADFERGPFPEPSTHDVRVRRLTDRPSKGGGVPAPSTSKEEPTKTLPNY